MTVPIRVESGLLAEWRQPSPETAVYRIYSADDKLLYIGITNDLYVRWTDHKSTKAWWRQEAHRYDVRWYPSREEAAAEERRAIISERPKHNQLCLVPSQRPVPSGQTGVYSVKQIAQRFRRSPQTVRDLATRPDFPRSVNGRSPSDRGGPRYSVEEIEAYFQTNPKQQGKRTDLASRQQQGDPAVIEQQTKVQPLSDDARAVLGIVWKWIEGANDGLGSGVGDLMHELETAGYGPLEEASDG